MVSLSILICSLQSRTKTRANLLTNLREQIGEHYTETIDKPKHLIEKYIGKQVEIIVCTDNKELKVGAKRNLLLREAVGQYITFIDDDDSVTEQYIEHLLDKINLSPDCIVFNAFRYHNGQPDRDVSYGIEHRKDYNTPKTYFRLPNHLMCVKKSIAMQVRFKEINFGEDSDYAKRLLPLLKTQERINLILYTYYFDDKLTETAK